MDGGVRPKRTAIKGSHELRDKSFHNLLEVGRLLFGSGFDLCHPSGPRLLSSMNPQHSTQTTAYSSSHCVQSTESLGGCGICSKLHALHVTYPIIAFQTLPSHADTESDWCCRTEWGWLARLVRHLSTCSFASFDYCHLIHLCEQFDTRQLSVWRSEPSDGLIPLFVFSSATWRTTVFFFRHRDMLCLSHCICVSSAQLLTLAHQQFCMMLSLASTGSRTVGLIILADS